MQEKKLRDAAKDLFDAVHDWHWGEPSDRAEFGDGDTWERAGDAITASMEQMLRVFASTTGETEMEKLVTWLKGWESNAERYAEHEGHYDYESNPFTAILEHITTQFGEEEGE